MINIIADDDVNLMVAEHDRKNQAAIAAAFADGRIDDDARVYLNSLYSDGIIWFREVFNVLGKCFGAPKAGVSRYDYAANRALDENIKISDINPLSPYMVYHRLDADPMRNQFFTASDDNRIDLSVTSIVSVIVGAQKSIVRALDKITGKYYDDYVNEVADTAYRVIADSEREASAVAIAEKIREKFGEKFITNASETVLAIIGRGHEKIAVQLVRELDKIRRPHLRLQDVWRVKCLFDLVPQIRTFIERIHGMAPNSILTVKDSFYNIDNPRNYRDAKIVLNIGTGGKVIPMEIICQVRTFFDFENNTHLAYEKARKSKSANSKDIESKLSEFMENGIKEYNRMICNCLNDLFERVGWNILYSRDNREESFFEGFPKFSKQYYPTKVVDAILGKLESAVENEVFRVPDAPLKLTTAQEFMIFSWMARFILISTMPYKSVDWQIAGNGVSERLFNFVMKELQRHYK